MINTNYKDSGVDVESGDIMSKYFHNATKKTWDLRKDVIGSIIKSEESFSGARYIDVEDLPKGTVMGSNFDGIGTKVAFSEWLGDYYTLGNDLLAMVCDDAVAFGGEPVLVGSVLDVNKIQLDDLGWNDLVKGYVDAAIKSNVAIINGEIAELGDRINGNTRLHKLNLNWCASCIWFANKNNLINTKTIKSGDYLVGLNEDGFRSNGFSLIRKIVKNCNCKSNEYQNIMQYFMKWKKQILKPSIIYTKAITDMTGGYNGCKKVDIHGIAHITGGGLYGKMKRILSPNKLGAMMDKLYEPPRVMLDTQKLGCVEDKEAYRTWNMGQGMVIITPEPDKVIDIAEKHDKSAKVIGEIIEGETIFIKNKGYYSKNNFLEFRY